MTAKMMVKMLAKLMAKVGSLLHSNYKALSRLFERNP